jgi:hypothetical protein
MANLETEDPGEVAQLSTWTAFDRFLDWNGIIGYTSTITDAIDGIRAASSIQEIRNLLSRADYNGIQAITLEYGHMNNQTLKLVFECLKSEQRPLALLGIKEVVG